jgi:two-component system cell cycle response regulator
MDGSPLKDTDRPVDDKSRNAWSRARILVVDDEPGIRETIHEAVRHAGFECHAASTGQEALAILEKVNVDVMIADIRMPGLNGFELTRLAKEHHDTDVILITGYGKDFQYEEAIEKGASEFILKPVRLQELLVRMKRVLKQRFLVAERRLMEEKLRELTITDSLTKLYNMRHFYTQLQLEMDRGLRYEQPLSLLLMDVDRFKQYNDTCGHLEGDRILTMLGEVIQERLRTNDTAYRYGGDEFIVILPQARGKQAWKVAERIRERFLAVHADRVPEKTLDTTLSIGVVEFRSGEELSDLVKRADQAMYKAKNQGGDRSLLEDD